MTPAEQYRALASKLKANVGKRVLVGLFGKPEIRTRKLHPL